MLTLWLMITWENIKYWIWKKLQLLNFLLICDFAVGSHRQVCYFTGCSRLFLSSYKLLFTEHCPTFLFSSLIAQLVKFAFQILSVRELGTGSSTTYPYVYRSGILLRTIITYLLCIFWYFTSVKLKITVSVNFDCFFDPVVNCNSLIYLFVTIIRALTVS